jgi:hypothetical protein
MRAEAIGCVESARSVIDRIELPVMLELDDIFLADIGGWANRMP